MFLTKKVLNRFFLSQESSCQVAEYRTDYMFHGHSIVYTLRVAAATREDDGTYACEGAELPKASEIVHVNSSASRLGGGSGMMMMMLVLFAH